MTAKALILVVDDDETVCNTIAVLLTSAGYMVKTYTSAVSCLEDNVAAGNCLIADIRMPTMSGLRLLEEVGKLKIGLPVIFITGFADIQLSVSAMKAGAVDFIEKPFDGATLLSAVAQALAVGQQTRGKVAEARAAREKLAVLTKRETDVFNLLIAGFPNKVAAHELGMSPRTIEVHRSHIMKKMAARSLSDLVRVGLAATQSPEAST